MAQQQRVFLQQPQLSGWAQSCPVRHILSKGHHCSRSPETQAPPTTGRAPSPPESARSQLPPARQPRSATSGRPKRRSPPSKGDKHTDGTLIRTRNRAQTWSMVKGQPAVGEKNAQALRRGGASSGRDTQTYALRRGCKPRSASFMETSSHSCMLTCVPCAHHTYSVTDQVGRAALAPCRAAEQRRRCLTEPSEP